MGPTFQPTPTRKVKSLSIEGAIKCRKEGPHTPANSSPLPLPLSFRGRGNPGKGRPRLWCDNDWGVLTEVLDLGNGDGPRSGTGARGVCRVCRAACHHVTRVVGALEPPTDLESMVTAADVRLNEVETVRRERAQNKSRVAVVIRGARRHVTRISHAELLETLVINDARLRRCGGRHWLTVEQHINLHCGRVPRVLIRVHARARK